MAIFINIPVGALEHAAHWCKCDCLCIAANEPLDTSEVELCATHAHSRHLHAIEEGRFQFREVRNEIGAIVVSFDLRHLEAVILACSILLCIIFIDFNGFREIG